MTGMARLGLLFLVITIGCSLAQPQEPPGANVGQLLHKLRAERQGDGPFTGPPPGDNGRRHLQNMKRVERQQSEGPYTGAPPGADQRNLQERVWHDWTTTVDGTPCAEYQGMSEPEDSGYSTCVYEDFSYSSKWCFTDNAGTWDYCCWGECQEYEPWWGDAYWFCYIDASENEWDYCEKNI